MAAMMRDGPSLGCLRATACCGEPNLVSLYRSALQGNVQGPFSASYILNWWMTGAWPERGLQHRSGPQSMPGSRGEVCEVRRCTKFTLRKLNEEYHLGPMPMLLIMHMPTRWRTFG